LEHYLEAANVVIEEKVNGNETNLGAKNAKSVKIAQEPKLKK